jgi:hypothetical protein
MRRVLRPAHPAVACDTPSVSGLPPPSGGGNITNSAVKRRKVLGFATEATSPRCVTSFECGLAANLTKGKPMRTTIAVAAFVSMGLLAGCGTKQPERAEGGAAAGAATGATVGLVGGPVGVVAGGLIGGAAGGATGAATKSKDVNVGAPPWQDNSATGQKAAKNMSN